MGKRTIRFNPFDRASVVRACQEARQFHEDLMKCCNEVLETLTIQGEERARFNVVSEDAIDTGYLHDSIVGTFNKADRVGRIVAEAGYAGYVEYGTGIVGAGNSHPTAEEDGWAYDVNHHGERGWHYWDPADGRRYWTMGYKARPFMYNTKLWLEQEVPGITATVFDKM